MDLIYKRILLKMSGEIIKDIHKSNLQDHIINNILEDIVLLLNLGVQISIVIGGGNLFRGRTLHQFGINRVTSDYIGMLSTVINGLFLKDLFEKFDIPVCLMSSLTINSICSQYNVEKANRLLSDSVVLIFCSGLGNPFFTTDSAACLRAIETRSEIVLKGTKVNGVYSKDPNYYQNSILYNQLTYDDVLKNEFKVMDLTAFILARDYHIPICIFNINHSHALRRILSGKKEGTIISDYKKI